MLSLMLSTIIVVPQQLSVGYLRGRQPGSYRAHWVHDTAGRVLVHLQSAPIVWCLISMTAPSLPARSLIRRETT